jgi:hypothetical protein
MKACAQCYDPNDLNAPGHEDQNLAIVNMAAQCAPVVAADMDDQVTFLMDEARRISASSISAAEVTKVTNCDFLVQSQSDATKNYVVHAVRKSAEDDFCDCTDYDNNGWRNAAGVFACKHVYAVRLRIFLQDI